MKIKKFILLWSLIGIGFLGLGVGAYLEEEETEQPVIEEVSVKEEEKDVVVEDEFDEENVIEEETVVEEEVEKDISESENAYLMLDILRTAFDGIADVKFDESEKTYIIHPTSKEFIRDFMLTYDGITSKDSWNAIVDNTVVVSNGVKERVGTGYHIKMTNPVNDDNALLIVSDGVIYYDVMESR